MLVKARQSWWKALFEGGQEKSYRELLHEAVNAGGAPAGLGPCLPLAAMAWQIVHECQRRHRAKLSRQLSHHADPLLRATPLQTSRCRHTTSSATRPRASSHPSSSGRPTSKQVLAVVGHCPGRRPHSVAGLGCGRALADPLRRASSPVAAVPLLAENVHPALGAGLMDPNAPDDFRIVLGESSLGQSGGAGAGGQPQR